MLLLLHQGMLTFTHCLCRSFTARLSHSAIVSSSRAVSQLAPFATRANSSFSGHNSVARLQHTYASYSSPEMLASAIAAPYKTELLDSSKAITGKLNRQPRLRGILANADEPSRVYAESTKKSCDEVGIEYELVSIGSEESPSQAAEVEQAVLEANMDDNVDGIMIYFPIFGAQEDEYLQQVVSPAKDVEGLHFFSRFNLYHNIRWIKPEALATGQTPALALAESEVPAVPSASHTDEPDAKSGLVKAILPCTSLAIVKALEAAGVYNSVLKYGQRAFGKTITVINRSEVVGRPLAALLANDGARVFSADIDNIVEYTRRQLNPDKVPAWHPRHLTEPCHKTLEECLALSDVVVSGVPSPKYKIPTSQLKDGVVALNFSSAKNFEANIKETASVYVPTIGKVTIAMLQRNLLRLVQYRKLLPQMQEIHEEKKQEAASETKAQ